MLLLAKILQCDDSSNSELFDFDVDGDKMHVRPEILNIIYTEVQQIQSRTGEVEKNLKRAIIVL